MQQQKSVQKGYIEYTYSFYISSIVLICYVNIAFMYIYTILHYSVCILSHRKVMNLTVLKLHL